LKKGKIVKKFFIFWKKITWIYVKFIQKILITIFLTIIYLVFFPFLWFFHLVFSKEKLNTKFVLSASYWKASKPAITEPEYYINQS